MLISKEISNIILRELVKNDSIFEINKLMRLNKYHNELYNKEELWERIDRKYYFHLNSNKTFWEKLEEKKFTTKEKFNIKVRISKNTRNQQRIGLPF